MRKAAYIELNEGVGHAASIATNLDEDNAEAVELADHSGLESNVILVLREADTID